MKDFVKLIAASAMVVASIAPAFAQTAMADPMTMTCADYSAMNSAGMMSSTQMMDTMMAMTPDEQTAAMAMTPEEKTAKMTEMETAMAAMTDAEKTAATTKTTESMTMMMQACKAMPDGTVLDAAKAAM